MADNAVPVSDEIWRPRPRVQFVSESDMRKVKWINLSHLLSTYDEPKRQRLWAKIKQRSAPLATLLQEPGLFDLVRTFNATLYVEDLR